MSNIRHHITRNNDTQYLSVSLSIDHNLHDRFCVSFYDQNKQLAEVISTTSGTIYKNSVTLSDKVSQFTVLSSSYENMECSIEYFVGNTMTGCENIRMSSPAQGITRAAIKTTKDTDYKPKWLLSISMLDDLCVQVVNHDEEKYIMVAFGDESKDITHADIVFKVFKDYSSFFIPREIVWRNRSKYIGSSLGCYEIVKKDRFYKVPISNCVGLNGFRIVEGTNVQR